MKRNSFDERRDMQIADSYASSNMPCKFCGNVAPVEDLNTYGDRCFDCYRRYCHQDRWFPSLTIEQRREMAESVKAALSGGLRPSPAEYLREMMSRDPSTLTVAQRGFLAAVRAHKGFSDAPAEG